MTAYAYGRVHEIIDHGDRSDILLMNTAAKLQEQGRVTYIDCRNTFDPYQIYKASDRDETAFDRIYVARPFTVYQLKELVYMKLEKLIQDTGSRILLISCINSFRGDGVLQEEEYSTIVDRVRQRIDSLTSSYNLLTVLSVRHFDG